MGFLFALKLINELMTFSFMQNLCRIEFFWTSPAPFLIPICDKYIQLGLVKSKMPCNFFGVQYPSLDQSVYGSLGSSQSQPVETKVSNSFMHPEDWGSFYFVFCLCVFHRAQSIIKT
jgi:hypothetical protein